MLGKQETVALRYMGHSISPQSFSLNVAQTIRSQANGHQGHHLPCRCLSVGSVGKPH